MKTPTGGQLGRRAEAPPALTRRLYFYKEVLLRGRPGMRDEDEGEAREARIFQMRSGKAWKATEDYGANCQTADLVVVRCSRIPAVRRKRPPGQPGTWDGTATRHED